MAAATLSQFVDRFVLKLLGKLGRKPEGCAGAFQ